MKNPWEIESSDSSYARIIVEKVLSHKQPRFYTLFIFRAAEKEKAGCVVIITDIKPSIAFKNYFFCVLFSWHSGNNLDLCSGFPWFKTLYERQLPGLRFL